MGSNKAARHRNVKNSRIAPDLVVGKTEKKRKAGQPIFSKTMVIVFALVVVFLTGAYYRSSFTPQKEVLKNDLKIQIKDINNHIICSICFGYFIDATSIAECLHTFCKSCIVKYLQSSKNCPTCQIRIHETQPLLNLRPDRTLQDIVYKLVPGLFENEEKRREDFYRSRGVLKKKKKGEDLEHLGPKVSTILNNPLVYQYKYDEQICLCLERYSAHQYIETHNMTYHLRSLDKKFIRCSVRVLVAHLTTIIKQKLDIPSNLQVQLSCGKVALDDDMSMKQIYLMYWYDKPSPMVLFYRLKPP